MTAENSLLWFSQETSSVSLFVQRWAKATGDELTWPGVSWLSLGSEAGGVQGNMFPISNLDFFLPTHTLPGEGTINIP